MMKLSTNTLVYICILLHGLVCNVAPAIRCKAEIGSLENLAEPQYDVTCGVNGLANTCNVMYTDDSDTWTYGCILEGSIDKCNKSYKEKGVTNNYCCCDTPNCNDKEFASKCGESSGGNNLGAKVSASFALTAMFSSIMAVIFI